METKELFDLIEMTLKRISNCIYIYVHKYIKL